ncbi:major capsid protein [Antheraea assamensis cypovirus 4]|uniref:Major capsid protein n=1 Tax=Antheraea assamensis cypovirus 4 TaxID=180166 RepID=A0AAE9SQR8_9REOV|nr:major capsid protein [Antheraea assamensis cypovirus 4]WPN08783.1 major capsid protein [Cypovirus 4]
MMSSSKQNRKKKPPPPEESESSSESEELSESENELPSAKSKIRDEKEKLPRQPQDEPAEEVSNTTASEKKGKDDAVSAGSKISKVTSNPKVDPDDIENMGNKHIKMSVDKSKNVTPAERAKTYHSEKATPALYTTGVEPIVAKWDQLLKVFAKYTFVTQPLQFITYKPTEPVLKDSTGLGLYERVQGIVGKSLEIFRRNTPLVTKDYNPELAKKLSVNVHNGTLFIEKQSLIPMTTKDTLLNNTNIYSNIEAEVKMLMYTLSNDIIKVHADKKDNNFEQVKVTSEPSSQIIPPTDKDAYPYFGASTSAELPLGPALPLVARALEIPPLTAYAEALGERAPPEGPRLELGANVRYYDHVHHRKVGHIENMLIDKFTAELLNINATDLMNERALAGQIQTQLLSCAWDGTQIELRQDMSLVPYFIIPRSIALASLIIAGCRSRELHDLLLSEGVDYLQECGLLSLVETPTFIVPSIATKLMAAQLRTDLLQMFKIGRLNNVYGLLASEVMPILQIPRFTPLYMEPRNPSCIVSLYLYVLMQLFLPNQFWLHCRMIANQLHRLFLHHFPEFSGLLITQLGVAQNVVDGVLEATPGNGNDFDTSSAFAEQVPTIFTPRIQEIQGHQAVTAIMNLFTPLPGAFIPDAAAVAAQHPRVQADPQHFIGIPNRQGFNLVRARIRAAANTCKGVLENRWMNTTKQEKGPVSEQIDWICERATDVMEAMCATLHLPYVTLANFPTAFMPNITQPIEHHINRNWTVESQAGGYAYTEGMRQLTDDRAFDCADFIALLFNTNWNFHDQKGYGIDSGRSKSQPGARLPNTINMPDPISFMQRQTMIVQACRNASLPDGLLSYLIYSDNVPPEILALRESWGLPDSSRIYSQLRHILGDISSLSPTWLKGFSKLTFNIGRDGRLNTPMLRRRREVNVPIPFVAAEDSPDMAQEVQFFMPVEIERLSLAVAMINSVKYARQGIRLVFRQQFSFTHQPILLPPDIREIEYESGVTFTTGREDHENVQQLIMADGTYSPHLQDWQNVHLIINEPISSSSDIASIEEGLLHAGMYVTLTYFRYVPTLSSEIVDSHTVESLLLKEAHDLTVIPFYFNTIRLEQSRFARPSHMKYQLIYPLEDVVDKHVVSGLATSSTEGPELHLALPGYSEYDTGVVNVDGRILHNDGVMKRNVRAISMANPVIGVHAPLAMKDLIMDIVIRAPRLIIE